MAPRLAIHVLASTLLLAACGDDVSGPAPGEFEELCGEAAPLRLLPLDPDQVPYGVDTRSFDDHYLISIRNEDFSVDDTSEIWSVGSCGEDPILLIDEVEGRVWGGHGPWPELPFVCSESSGSVFALDPTGARPPNAAFETRDCFRIATPQGLIAILGEGPTGPLVLQPWPDDPLAEAAEQIVLVDEARAEVVAEPHTWPSEREVLRVVGSEVFSVTAADELVVISLDDLGVELLAEGVREIEPSASGRYVLFQGIEVTNDDPKWPEGPLFLLDREDGETTQIDETALAYTVPSLHFTLEGHGLLHYRVGAIDDETADRWLRLDTLEPYEDVPGLWYAQRLIDDDRVLLDSLSSSKLLVLDLSSGELSTLWDNAGDMIWTHGEGLWIQRNDGELVALDYDGEARTLARQVTTGWRMLSGERVITPFAVNEDDVGSLTIVNPETLDERYIDHEVLRRSMSVPDLGPGELPGTNGELVSYMVVDHDPERHGVWLAKPR